MVKYCKSCGSELKEDSVFCDECGTKVGESYSGANNGLSQSYNIDMMDGELGISPNNRTNLKIRVKINFVKEIKIC